MTAKFSIFLALGLFCLAFLMTITSRADSFIPQVDIIHQLKQTNRMPASSIDFSGLKGDVDLREFDSPVEHQFGGTCSTFAVVAAIENLSKAIGKPQSVSKRYLWSLYERYSMDAAIETATKNYLTNEASWPINQTKPNPDYLDHLSVRLAGTQDLKDDLTQALRALDQKHPVVMALQVPRDLYTCMSTIRPNSLRTRGQHVVEAVGYHLDSQVGGGGYFILKNSWGDTCGDKGYHYFPFSICNRSGFYCEFTEVSSLEIRS